MRVVVLLRGVTPAEKENTTFEGEIFRSGTECLYMYLPRDAAKKKLNTPTIWNGKGQNQAAA